MACCFFGCINQRNARVHKAGEIQDYAWSHTVSETRRRGTLCYFITGWQQLIMGLLGPWDLGLLTGFEEREWALPAVPFDTNIHILWTYPTHYAAFIQPKDSHLPKFGFGWLVLRAMHLTSACDLGFPKTSYLSSSTTRYSNQARTLH